MADGTAADGALPILARTFALLPPAPRPATPQPSAGTLAGPLPGDALSLLFPPPSATIEGGGPILLRASGGERPLVFLVDGAVLASTPALRDTRWTPPGPGFYRIAVLDAGGHAAQAAVRVTGGKQGRRQQARPASGSIKHLLPKPNRERFAL